MEQINSWCPECDTVGDYKESKKCLLCEQRLCPDCYPVHECEEEE